MQLLFLNYAWKKSRAKLSVKSWKSTPWNDSILTEMDSFVEEVKAADIEKDIGLYPYTMTHGDFHGANMLTCQHGRGEVALDFQIVGIGEASTDLGKFLVQALSADVRRAHEERLLRTSGTVCVCVCVCVVCVFVRARVYSTGHTVISRRCLTHH